jgi:hypothetical protein
MFWVKTAVDYFSIPDLNPDLTAIRHCLFRPKYAEPVLPEPICRVAGDAQQYAAICPRVVWEVAFRGSEYMPCSPFIDCDRRRRTK